MAVAGDDPETSNESRPSGALPLSGLTPEWCPRCHEVEPRSHGATARLHYSIKTSSAATGDMVATPRGFEPLLQP